MKSVRSLFIFLVILLLIPAVHADWVEPQLCTASPSINYLSGGNSLLAQVNLSDDCPLPGEGAVNPPEMLHNYTVLIERRTFFPLTGDTVTETIYSANYSAYEVANYSTIFSMDITGYALQDYHSYKITVALVGEAGNDDFFWGFNSGWVAGELKVLVNPDLQGGNGDFKVEDRDRSDSAGIVSPTNELKSR